MSVRDDNTVHPLVQDIDRVDTTPACMEQMMRTMNSPEVADFLATKKYQSVK
jgi:hypothetical protein